LNAAYFKTETELIVAAVFLFDLDLVLSGIRDALGHTVMSSLPVLSCCCSYRVFPAGFHLKQVVCNHMSLCLPWFPAEFFLYWL